MANPNPYPYLRPSSAAGPGIAAEDLRSYLIRVYNYMTGGLVLTGTTAYVGAASGFYLRTIGTPLYWIILLAPLGLVLLLGYRIQRMSVTAAQLTFWTFAVLMGLSLSGIFIVYTGESIARVFFITGATFGAASLYAYTTHRDLSRFGSFLFMGLIGILIAMVVNIFLKSTALQMTVSVMGVIVFTGLAAYDTQKIRALYVQGEDGAVATKKSILGALALYLDFLNLFLFLLRLMGSGSRR
jgi:uncharacterized protein